MAKMPVLSVLRFKLSVVHFRISPRESVCQFHVRGIGADFRLVVRYLHERSKLQN